MPRKSTVTKELTKDDRIKKEYSALKRSYKKLPKETMNVVEGLIKRAAFMKISLEDMEKDLDENGFVEDFQQSDKVDAYERERPIARLYNSMNKNYQSIIKELTSHLDQQAVTKIDSKEDNVNVIELFANARR